MNRTRLIRVALACAVALVAAFLIASWQAGRDRQAGGAGATGAARVGGPFSLMDHTGRAVTDADYRGRLMLVYFGFTFCPDVCPTDLQAMAGALDSLGPDAGQVSALFVTVDPERDTPERLAAHVALFHPGIAGLTGTPEQIREAARAYKVYYAKAAGSDPGAYSMDHSAFIYLMGRDGGFLEVIPHGADAGRIAEAVRRHLGG
jgi:protein SCO1/2